MLYLVIIGDIIKSRKLSNRYEVQETFSSVVSEAQIEYGKDLVSPITLTIGDEFQSVMANANDLFKIVDKLDLKMHPVQLRYGFGIGTIDTKINKQISIGMDGPAFHRAREALDVARKQNRRYYFRMDDGGIENAINLLLKWMDAGMQNWSDTKKKILVFKERGYTQTDIALRLQITQPAISQHLRSPFFNLISETRVFIQDRLQRILSADREHPDIVYY